jgi:hypothetical protein
LRRRLVLSERCGRTWLYQSRCFSVSAWGFGERGEELARQELVSVRLFTLALSHSVAHESFSIRRLTATGWPVAAGRML